MVLSAQLPFAIFPQLRFPHDKALMGVFANGLITHLVAWSLFVVIATANGWLVVQTFIGGGIRRTFELYAIFDFAYNVAG